MTPEMREVFGSISSMSAFRDQLDPQFGDEAEVLKEDVREEAGAQIYLRTSR